MKAGGQGRALSGVQPSGKLHLANYFGAIRQYLELQEKSVQLFDDLAKSAPGKYKELFLTFHDYAVRHRDIIKRFGRFPHRNKILGRDSTPDEIEFLKEPGSSF